MAPFRGRVDPSVSDPVTNPLLAVARGVLEKLELDVVLNRVLDAAQTLTQAQVAALGVLTTRAPAWGAF